MSFNILDVVNTFIDKYTTEVVGGLTVMVITLALNYILKFIKNIKTTKKYSGYIGNYFIYSYSTIVNENKISRSTLSIKSKFGRLVVKENNAGVYDYIGSVFITERNIYILLKGVNHTEWVQYVFYSPLHRKIKKLVGLYSAVSVIDEPFSGVCIFSDIELTEEKILNEFKNNGFLYENSILRIEKKSSIYYDNIDN